jgi:hypothetical protein
VSDANELLNELFTKKDFLDFFGYSNPMHIIEVLGSFREHHFSDLKHYNMYKQFVVPKLKLVGKAFSVRKRVHKYLYYITLEVVLTKNYCVLKFNKNRYILEFVNNGYGSYSTQAEYVGRKTDSYLLGFNSDGKLFVNKIPLDYIDYRDSSIKGYDLYSRYGVAVIRAEDSFVSNILGYSNDYADRERIIIMESGNYRVQGEVILSAIKVNCSNVSETIGDLGPIGIVHEALIDYLRRYIANELMRALIDIGFNVQYARELNLRHISHRHVVIIPECIPIRTNFSELRLYANLVIKALSKALNGYNIIYNPENVRDVIEFRIANDMINAEIQLDAVAIDRESTYASIILIPNTIDIDTTKLYWILFNELREALKNVKPQDYTIVIGNHVINIRNAIALNIEYVPLAKPRIPVLSDWVIRFNLGYYYVDNSSIIEINHKEHGSVTIQFNGKYLIEFRTNNVDRSHISEWNRAVLYTLPHLVA